MDWITYCLPVESSPPENDTVRPELLRSTAGPHVYWISPQASSPPGWLPGDVTLHSGFWWFTIVRPKVDPAAPACVVVVVLLGVGDGPRAFFRAPMSFTTRSR